MKNIIITGADGNLGTVVTNHFLQQGFRVIATVLHEQAKKSFSTHKNLRVELVDLRNEAAVASFVSSSIQESGKIDAAFMLAGGFAMGNIASTNTEAFHQQLSLNFETAYHVARPLLSHLLENNFGRLVFVGSRPALVASAGKEMIAYGLSKSLLFKLAEYINAESKGKNVTATVLVPSTIDTETNRKSMPDANFDSWVKPEKIAGILAFLLSETALPLRETILKVYNDA